MKSNSRYSLIKQLQSAFPRGRPFDVAELNKLGVSTYLAAKYAQTGWLVRLAHGVYGFPEDSLDRDACLLFLQERVPGFHVGGKTALSWQGMRHNLSAKESLVLWGEGRLSLPLWFTGKFPARYQTTRLFRGEGQEREFGLTTLPAKTFPVKVSAPERAILELLSDVGKRQSLEEARHLFESLRGVRPEVVGALLERCTSVKVVRLFLLWASETSLLDIGEIRSKYSINTGGARRWMSRLKDGTLLSLPAQP